MRIPPPPFPERLSKLFNIPVYSTFPLLVISKPWVLLAAAVHSRKFYFPEGLGISEGPWMKDYESACELVRAALFLVIMSCSPPYLWLRWFKSMMCEKKTTLNGFLVNRKGNCGFSLAVKQRYNFCGCL